jgi:hypothetical protein
MKSSVRVCARVAPCLTGPNALRPEWLLHRTIECCIATYNNDLVRRHGVVDPTGNITTELSRG